MSKKVLELFGRISMMQKRDGRSVDLLRYPKAEYAKDWYMCVPKCFNDALDIKMKPRVIDGDKSLQWTQGSTFSFEAGNVLYDTPKAYEPWPEAMKHINRCIQVREASQAIPGEKKTDKKPSVDRNGGFVRFDLLIPNRDRSMLIKDREETMTQDEFVRFLIAGPSAETQDLFG